MFHVYPLDPLPNTRLDLIAFVVLGLRRTRRAVEDDKQEKTKS